MGTITFTDNAGFLSGYLSKDARRTAFFVLNECRGSRKIKELLRSAPGVREISKREVLNKIGQVFKNEFSKAIYRINKEKNDVAWWAMNFTDKHPHMSKLYERAYYLAAVREIVSGSGEEDLILVSDDRVLSTQLKIWAKSRKMKYVSKISRRHSLSDILRTCTGFAAVNMLVRLSFRKAVSRMILGPRPAVESDISVIVSQFEKRSIGPSGLYKDIYFGDMDKLLAGFPSSGNKRFITIGFSPYFGSREFTRFVKALRNNPENRDLFPIEHFLNIRKMAVIFAKSAGRYFFRGVRRGDISIHGEDVSFLLRNEIRESFLSGQSILNLTVHAAALAVSAGYDVNALYYPFENRSWEKMVVTAFRKNSPKTRITGYIHTVITPKHLNFFMEEDEYGDIPGPDRIVANGEITREIMKGCNIPDSVLRTGCALRFSIPDASGFKRREAGTKKILAALASGIDEYVRMLIFLDEAFRDDGSYDITIRPHPTLPLDKALGIFAPARMRYKVSRRPLAEDLDSCDIVLYAASTVSLEALALGKPVICIDTDDFLDSDPIFGNEILKWRCRDPRDLVGLIRKIGRISEEDLKKMREDASEYVRKYFHPVTHESLSAFVV